MGLFPPFNQIQSDLSIVVELPALIALMHHPNLA